MDQIQPDSTTKMSYSKKHTKYCKHHTNTIRLIHIHNYNKLHKNLLSYSTKGTPEFEVSCDTTKPLISLHHCKINS